MKFQAHHFMLSVRNVEASAKFYALLGFSPLSDYRDDEVRIAQFQNADGFIVELFEYEFNKNKPMLDLTPGNNLEELGVRHFGFCVDDLTTAYEFLSQSGYKTIEPRIGRTKGMEYFFVQDTDGNWVEIATDSRIKEKN